MLLTPFCLVMSCLRVVPDRTQFYRYNSISLSCEDRLNSTGWKVKRRTPEGGVRPCTSGWGTASSGSACVIGNTYPSDTGVYWCESGDGNRSNSINITITDSTVILESPALAVSEGAALTLRCKAETESPNHTFDFLRDGRVVSSSAMGEMTVHRASKSDEGLYICSIPGFGKSLGSWVNVEVIFLYRSVVGSACVIGNTYPSDTGVYWCESGDGNRSNSINITITDSTVILESPALAVSEGAALTLRCKAETESPNHTFDFLRDGRVVSSSAMGEMTVHRASKSDEGLYICSIPGFGKSLGSWVNVEGSLLPSSSPPPAASCSVSVTRLIFHVLVGTPYLLSTILLGLVYRDRNRAARAAAERRGSTNVIMEIVV